MGDLFTEITQAWADAARAGRSSVPVVTGAAYALSAAEAGAAIRALTVAMDDRGVPAGAAVLHVTARRPDWALVVAGLISSHRVWLPAPPDREQIKLALRHSGARWVVAENPAQLELITAAASTGAVWCAPAAGGRWHLAELAPGEPDGSQKNAALPAEAAYLIPTSGSTGNAKWVVGSRRGLEHFIRWELGLLGTEPGTNFAQLTPATFDPVLREIFVAFASRGCLCVPGDIARLLDPVALADWLDATGTGVLHLTPTLLRALLPVLIGRPPLRRLGHLLLAGEELFHGDVAELAAHYGSALRIYNLYGPTETTLAKFCHRVTPDDLGSGEPGQRIPVGTPISGTTAIRLAPAGTPCLPGEVGEIYIRTAYRSLGYLGTSRGEPPPAFTPNPFSSDPAEVVFATRDLAYCRADGAFVIVGRADRAVKVRGVRVDLAAVESTLRSLDGIRDAAVRPYRTAANHTALAAYVVSEDRIDANALRRVLRDRLISQEVPAAFVHLAELPKTTSGKVDHAALPVPANERTGAAGLPADDLTEFERAILRVFASVMPAEIGPDDELLDVGGQSIEAARIAARIGSICGAEISLRALLDHSSPRAAARYLTTAYPALAAWSQDQPSQVAPESSRRQASRVDDAERVPVSYAQRRFWAMQRLAPDAPQLHYVWAQRLSGLVDRARLQDALGQVTTRHTAIRTRFIPDGADLYQAFDTQPPVTLTTARPGGGVAGGSKLDTALADVARWAAQPFAFGDEPLLRARWIDLGEDDGIFALTGHVIVSDGWTKAVLLEDLAAAYARSARGHEPDAGRPPAPEATFADFARWEREATPSRLERYAAYWDERFGDYFARPRLPFDRPEQGRPAVSAGESLLLTVPPPQAAALRKLARQWRVSMTALTGAAMLVSLHHWSGEAEPAVQVPVPNRPGGRYERVAGCFTDEVLLRERVTDGEPFAVLATRTAADLIRALDNAVAYDALVEAIRPGADRSDPAFAPMMFAPQPQVSRGFTLPNVTAREHRIDLGTSVWPLQLYQYDGHDGISCLFSFATNGFSRAAVHRLGTCYLGVLEGLAADPCRTVGTLLLVAGEGRGARR